MNVNTFVKTLGADFYTGVPDSQLKPFCDYLISTYGINPAHHIIAANEGNCTALAAGYHLATGKVPVVYLQNSGEGNIINPVASLLSEEVYAIPVIFVIGWRGEPGVHDEPQHIYQGQITLDLLDNMDIRYFVLGKESTEQDLAVAMYNFRELLQRGKSVAFVVRKGALTYDNPVSYHNEHSMLREDIICHICDISGEDPIISTTGKASRELFEIRTARNQNHSRDFLTVGSMGHSSSIALGIALQKPDTKVWCIDGDASALMHMGAIAVIGSNAPKNLVHIVINNEAHETVGGMPTVAQKVNLTAIAKACGYVHAVCVEDVSSLDHVLKSAKASQDLFFIEAKAAIGARDDLGRPTTTAQENKAGFMKHLQAL